MGAEQQEPTLQQSFAPFVGIGVGGVFSWAAVWLSEHGDASLATLQGRILAIVTSLLWWAVFTTMLQGKEIYGGGMVVRPINESHRTIWIAGGLLLTWALAAMAFVAGKSMVFWVCAWIQTLTLLGEVGWKDPLFFYLAAAGRRKKRQ